MSRSIEHIVDTYRIASERQAVGRPIWDRKFDVSDVFHNESMTFEQRRDAICSRPRAHPWFAENRELENIVEELEFSEDGDEFDGPWDALYDEADYDRVWIETR